MERKTVTQLCELEALDTAARLFGTSKAALGKFDDYKGCANLVYHYETGGQPRILRLSYRPDRTAELIQAELHFVEYLAAGGVRVSKPIPSVHGNLLDEYYKNERRKFLKARGNESHIYGVAFSPDDHILANDELRAVAFSLDGTLLAPGGYDKQIYLWGVPH